MPSLRNTAYNLLRRSETFFKTDMVYLAKGGFWLNGAQIATAGVSFLLAIAFANLLTQEAYGTYKYILSIAAIFGSITLSGLGSAVSRAVARGYEGEFLKSVRYNLKWETLISVAGLIGAAYYYVNGNQTLALGLLIIAIFSPLHDSAELYSAYLTGKKDFRTISILGVIKTVVTASWIYATILITQNPIAIVFSYFFIYTTVNSVFLWWVTQTRKPNESTDNETVALAKHTSLINNVSGFVDQLDNILIFHYFGPVSLAVYNFAIAIPEYLAGFNKNIGALAMPKFASAEKSVIKKTINQKSFKMFLFGGVIAAAYIITSPILFTVIFPQYLSSITYSQVYALIIPLSISALPVAFLNAHVAIKEKYISSVIANAFKLVLIFVGVIYFGLWGLIAARLISKAISTLVAFVFAHRI